MGSGKVSLCVIDSDGRECTKCGEYKLYKDYHTMKSHITGYRPVCRACRLTGSSTYTGPYQIDNEGRECTKCNTYKTREHFHLLERNVNGLKEICKECKKLESKGYYASKSPEELMLMSARGRATSKGLEFNLDISDIIIPKRCPIMGIKLVKNKGNQRHNSPSLDKIDPTKGYVKGNVAVISNAANSLKKNFTLEQVAKLHKYMRKETI